MKYPRELVKQWAEEIRNTAKQATTCSYIIRYSNVNGFDPTDKDAQKDILEYLWDFNNLDDELRDVDFNDVSQCIVVMWYEPPKKEEIEEVKKMKKYTLENYKEFCDKALICPPFEDEENWQKWIDEHKIQIIANECEIELDYDADAINEIEFSLREIHNAILGDGTATTGNTVGSEYPNATWKDILRFAVLSQLYGNECRDYKEAIWKCIHRFSKSFYAEVMKKIDEQTSYNDELEVNLFKLETKDLWKIFDEEERRQAFKEILCSKIEIEELIDENGARGDKVVITDYSIRPFGDLVGWHYGVEWDKNHEDNQWYIRKYIEEMTK